MRIALLIAGTTLLWVGIEAWFWASLWEIFTSEVRKS